MVSAVLFARAIEPFAYLPPCVRRIGLPVRVMATSEMGCLRRTLCATFWVDRTAVGKEAIVGYRGGNE